MRERERVEREREREEKRRTKNQKRGKKERKKGEKLTLSLFSVKNKSKTQAPP